MKPAGVPFAHLRQHICGHAGSAYVPIPRGDLRFIKLHKICCIELILPTSTLKYNSNIFYNIASGIFLIDIALFVSLPDRMETREHIDYWIKSAEHDLESAESLYASGKYDWCLFICHIVIEKALKAAYVKTNNNQLPPKIHNLSRLAELSPIGFSMEDLELLDKINDFNIEARYPDFRFSFYEICTKDFTTEYFNKVKELFKWIKSRIQ